MARKACAVLGISLSVILWYISCARALNIRMEHMKTGSPVLVMSCHTISSVRRVYKALREIVTLVQECRCQKDAAIACAANIHPEDGHTFRVMEAPGPEEVPTLMLQVSVFFL